MAIVNKRFEIRTNPIDEKLIRKHLDEINGFVYPTSTVVLRNSLRPVVVAIKGSIRQEEIDNLIGWLHKNIESAVSIIL